MTKGLPRKINQKGTDGSVGLARLLPTPRASDGSRGAQIVSGKSIKRPSGQVFSSSLTDLAISKLLPTPQAVDGHKTTKASSQDNLNKTFQTGGTSQLNPLFVAEMMGFPPDWTVLPFLGGDQKA